MGDRASRGDRGQAAVELAAALPLVVLLLLALVQVGLVVRDQIMVVHAAREGARAAAVAGGDGSAADVGAKASIGRPAHLVEVHTTTDATAGTVTVEVSYQSPTDVPLVGALLGDVELRARATMHLEPEP